MSENIEILDEEVLYLTGSFLRKRRWLRGKYPELGQIINGYTGVETVVEVEVVKPMQCFVVIET